MKKNFLTNSISIFISIVLLSVFTSCMTDTGGSDIDEGNGIPSTVKINMRGQRVVNIMWGEPEEDPRQVIGYQLEDGTPYFDHYVMLYGFRLRDYNCAADPEMICNRTSLHLCFMNNVFTHYLADWDKYIKPVRDRGIKVIMSIVPQNSGVCVGTLYNWPMEQWYSWKSLEGEDQYPYGEEAVRILIEQIKEFYEKYPFDGIGYDEEYGSTKTSTKGRGEVYPNTGVYPGINANLAGQIGGANILRFAHEVNMALGKEISHEAYEIRYGTSIPASFTYPADWQVPEEWGMPADWDRTIRRNDLIAYSYQPYYGSWQADSAINLPRHRFGPASVAIADVQGSPKPASGKNGIQAKMEDHLRGNYGVIMYYCLRDRAQIADRFPNAFGPNNPPPEMYFSQISSRIYGQETVYIGPDYPRVWW